jgi:LuxR family transcriptional regulator, positive regulator of biofilm formation
VFPTLGIEYDALTLGVSGIFYVKDPLEQLIKGISAVLNGELWVPRRVMSECLKKNLQSERSNNDGEVILSARENQVITLVAAGLSNDEIANRFCISAYTVKSHLHNIFKKINVQGRTQAALWANKNL